MRNAMAFLLLVGLLLPTITFAQITVTLQNKDTTKSDSRIRFSGMILTRYSQSLSKHVDASGNYHAGEEAFATSSFVLRRTRLQAKAQITPRAAAAVMLNLTDFNGNPAGKVLENAYITYCFSSLFNLQVGQFRPYFGKEDLYPEELLQALEWTNLYYAFGANGWQSFQTGATLFGKTQLFSVPIGYFLGAFNGNGRNQPMDNDNGKLFPARLEFIFWRNTRLGLNAGLGKDRAEKVWALAVDVDQVEHLGKRWDVELQSEYKTGINNALFDTSSEQNKRMKDYQLAGFYVSPNLKYNINTPQLKTIEFSLRYEKLNCDTKRNGSSKQTYMPVIGLQLADAYFLRFQAGLIIDYYRYQSAFAKEHNATRFIFQLQARF